ncbi:MAG: DNA gyrase inhibitor YacG [Pseudomonadota bacterium]
MREQRVSGGKCPICGQPTLQSMRPFCSKRCADVDLGRWLTGAYAIPGEDTAEDEDRQRASEHDRHLSDDA